ncbi:hypothetical protein K1719_003794 [Acacia pycnantha]|nr:hypothetical protein K1719_003794 [Acacia pycnantha]
METACYFEELMGKFIWYDEDSHLNSYGLRIQICISELGLNSINSTHFQLLDDNILEVSLVLAQVGRMCPCCLGIGHVARNCKFSSNLQPQVHVFVVGTKSGSAKCDDFSGLYISTAQRTGIRIGPQKVLTRGVAIGHRCFSPQDDIKYRCMLKRKVESSSFANMASKRTKLHVTDDTQPDRKRKHGQELSSDNLQFKRARNFSKDDHVDSSIKIGIVRRKRKRFSSCEDLVISFPTLKKVCLPCALDFYEANNGSNGGDESQDFLHHSLVWERDQESIVKPQDTRKQSCNTFDSSLGWQFFIDCFPYAKKDYEAILRNCWNQSDSGSPSFRVHTKLSRSLQTLSQWSKSCIGNLPARIAQVEQVLNNISKEILLVGVPDSVKMSMLQDTKHLLEFLYYCEASFWA